MAAIDKLIERMVQHKAERVVLCNEQPIRLFVDGREASGAVLGAAQLRGMMQEVTPPELRSQLAYKSSFQFPYTSQQGIFDFTVVNGNGALQVTITPHRADLINFVDVDRLDFSFDFPTQASQPQVSNTFPNTSNTLANHIDNPKVVTPTPSEADAPPAIKLKKRKSPNLNSSKNCWYCKTRISDEPESVFMHRGTENKVIVIPRCGHCKAEEEKVSPLTTFYMMGGCVGSIATTTIYFMFVYSYMVAHASPRANAFLGMIFIFSPYILWMLADNDKVGHIQHPEYIAARAEGFTNNLHRP